LTNNQPPNYVIPQELHLRFGGTIKTSWITGLAYDEQNNALWLGDRDNHRVIRIACPLNQGCQRQVDLILGQDNLNNFPGYDFQGANRNQDDPFKDIPGKPRCPNMAPDGFGFLTSLTLDNFGNLYIIDSIHEGWGCSNNRVVEYDRIDLVPHPTKNFFTANERVPQRVYGGSGFTAEEKNIYRDLNNPYTPISVSFTKDNEMLLTADGYGNSYLKRIFWYDNPLPGCSLPCRVEPSHTLPISAAQPRQSSWDNNGNVAILDHTWNRVLLFGLCRNNDTQCPSGCTPQNDNDCSVIPTPTPTNECPSGHLGDLNCDQEINETDLNILFQAWAPSGPVATPRPNYHTADLNNDHKVDEIDLNILLENWKM